MGFKFSRRRFFAGAGVAAAASAFPRVAHALTAPIYPAMDLSYFDTPIRPEPGNFLFGCAAITWEGKDRQAIDDIASLGYRGIQLREPAIKEFRSPDELRDLLFKRHLTLVALSSGNVRLDPKVEAEDLAKHTANAKFMRDAGGLYLQVIDQKPKDRALVADDYKRLGRLLSEVGKRTQDVGLPLGYHNHMGSCGEKPEEVDRIMDAADPRYVKLELDIAHYVQGGGDPVKAIEKYRDRLLFLHLKDVVDADPKTSSKGRTHRFVELGRGRVDVPAVLAALERVKFRGWAVVELDGPTDGSRTPKESAAISKDYLEKRLGQRV
jgi:inosose dehydratase